MGFSLCKRIPEGMTEEEFLPPSFKVWCSGCGWKGKSCEGMMAYLMGVNCPIEEDFVVPKMKCPKCKRNFNRLIEKEDLLARFRWVVEKLSAFGRDPEIFPCSCGPQPSCRLTGEVRVYVTTMGDTAFLNDQSWFRISGGIKCNGCYAEGRVALIEKHNNNQVYNQAYAEDSPLIKALAPAYYNYDGILLHP